MSTLRPLLSGGAAKARSSARSTPHLCEIHPSCLCRWFISFAAHCVIKGTAPKRDRSIAVEEAPESCRKTQKPMIRCAIYTRKSSKESLDQAFNSLDAQHEACAACVASQRHEGWKLIPDRFDDGETGRFEPYIRTRISLTRLTPACRRQSWMDTSRSTFQSRGFSATAFRWTGTTWHASSGPRDPRTPAARSKGVADLNNNRCRTRTCRFPVLPGYLPVWPNFLP